MPIDLKNPTKEKKPPETPPKKAVKKEGWDAHFKKIARGKK